MTECQKCRNQIDIHLDNELLGRELETFLEHLSLCAECQAEFSERRSFLQGIRSVRPLYTASAGLHRRIAALLDAGTETSSISVTGAAAHIRNRCHNLPRGLDDMESCSTRGRAIRSCGWPGVAPLFETNG